MESQMPWGQGDWENTATYNEGGEKIKEAADYALESPFPNTEDLYTDVYI